MELSELNNRVLITSLNSQVCPACGLRKSGAVTLCPSDYRSLPTDMQRALYRGVGHGYLEAVLRALTFLDVIDFKMPEEEKRVMTKT